MDSFQLVQINLLSPMVLAFVLGLIAALIRSDLRLPEALYQSLSIYLLFAIGLKGGLELSTTSLVAVWKPALATLALGVVTPLIAYAISRKLGKLDAANAGALAAHYGSVSAVTFTAATTFAQAVGAPVEGFMPTLVVVLEIPAILIGVLLAKRALKNDEMQWGKLLHELFTGKSIVLIVGGLLIGVLVGKDNAKQVAPLFVDLFRGALTLFLLELGIVAGQRLRDLRRAGVFLVLFGILVPVLHGGLGVVMGQWAGLSLGGCMVLGTMAASASYIAAPAAVRIVLPQANPGYYLTAALGITFPFNLVLGMPLYFALARFLTS